MTRRMLFVPALAAVLALAGFVSGAAKDTPAGAAPASWSVDKSHSQVKFKVRHLGISNVEGRFDSFDMDVRFDPADLKTLAVTARVEAGSINTENERRDNHLRSDDFFAAAEHPEITFVSKEVRQLQGGAFQLAGDLTIRGTTKPVVFDAELTGVAEMRGRTISGFTATTTINRFDYGLKWGAVTEAGGLVVGENVQVTIDVELVRQDASPPQG